MKTKTLNPTDFLLLAQEDSLEITLDSFYRERFARGCTKRTVVFYQDHLIPFTAYLESQAISLVSQIRPADIRNYLLALEARGTSQNWVHGAYRSIKAWLRWYESEYEPIGWVNPIKKVHSPKVDAKLLPPTDLLDIKKLIGACGKELLGRRDYALLLFLLDTGTRASEALAIDLCDVNLAEGCVALRHTKNKKERMVFISVDTKKALRSYLRLRTDTIPYLWITKEGTRLSYDGLRGILQRRAQEAGIERPKAHGFRRAFAIGALRAGADAISISRLLGHSSLTMTMKYINQDSADLQKAHDKIDLIRGLK